MIYQHIKEANIHTWDAKDVRDVEQGLQLQCSWLTSLGSGFQMAATNLPFRCVGWSGVICDGHVAQNGHIHQEAPRIWPC